MTQMKERLNKLVLFGILALVLVLPVRAAADDATVFTVEQKEVVVKIGELLNKNYVYPETAKKMSAFLLKNFKKGIYKNLTAADDFAMRLTDDLREISKDKHLRVRYSPEMVTRMRKMDSETPDPEEEARRLRERKRENFEFKTLQILDGNIGYLDLRGFSHAGAAGPTAVAAMNFLANCDALIIDLRENGGGSPGMIQLLMTYLYPANGDLVHLNNFYWRPTDTHTQTWTLPHVPGPRLADTPVYVLTSSYTFSAAEEFSYNIKNLKRGVLVGETTGGGAHPGGPQIINDNFFMGVPSGKAINPISKTNWEGTGVEPDVKVPRTEALLKARYLALEKLAEKAQNDGDKKWYQWYLDGLKAELEPDTVDLEILKSYAGQFGPRTILFAEGCLFYQRENGPKLKMIPISNDLFAVTGAPYFRLRVLLENGKVTALEGNYEDGRKDKNQKTK